MKSKKVEIIKEKGLGILTFLATTILVIGTIFYHYIEGWGWIDSLYFSVVTLTTIGYGDITPTTALSKLFTIGYIIIGIGIILGFINLVVKKNFEKNK